MCEIGSVGEVRSRYAREQKRNAEDDRGMGAVDVREIGGGGGSFVPPCAAFLRTEPVAGRNMIGANVCQIRRCAHRRFRQPCIPYNPFREQPQKETFA